MQVLVQLVNCGNLSASDFVDICATQLQRQEPIGRIALRRRFLTVGQVFRIVEMQTVDRRPFGELAISLGFLSRQIVQSLLFEQLQNRPSLQSVALEMGLVNEDDLSSAHRVVSLSRLSLEVETEYRPLDLAAHI
jgi:hypothetical protein